MFIAVRVLICSVKIFFVSARYLMVLVNLVSAFFTLVVPMARLYNSLVIFSFVVMAIFTPLKLSWVEFMHCSLQRSLYSSVNNFLNVDHVFHMWDSFATTLLNWCIFL